MLGDQGTVNVRKDMLKTCWPWHAEEPNMAKQLGESSFTSRFGTYCISICCFFRLEASTKKLFVSFNLPCFVLFFCLSRCCGSSGKYCKHSVYMIISRELERRELEKRELERRELERRELERVGESWRELERDSWTERELERDTDRVVDVSSKLNCFLVDCHLFAS